MSEYSYSRRQMQFSELEREMHNSPLKCTTNNEMTESPAKGSSPKLQDQAYRNSGEKKQRSMASPTKPSQQRRQSPTQQSPDKPTTSMYAAENARMEDPSYRSPPQKKFSSPKRPSVMSSSKNSPSKHVAPFGKPLEVIKSKYIVILFDTQNFSVLLRVLNVKIDLFAFMSIDELYWIADARPATNIHNAFFFNIDNVSGISIASHPALIS